MTAPTPTLTVVTWPAPVTVADALVTVAVRLAGGATVTPGGLGAWRDPEGRVVNEPVTVVTVYAEADAVADLVAALTAEAARLGERAVAYALTPAAAVVALTEAPA